ncbi:MAG: hypothetical protein R6U70_06990 [Bacillota bacterium]
MTDERVRRYRILFEGIAARAEEALSGDSPAERCDILTRLHNDYLENLREILGEEMDIFSAVGESEDVKRQLTEVMVRSEQVAAWLGSGQDAGRLRSRTIRLELPPIPSMSGIVNREKMERFAQEMGEWGRTVGERVKEISQEISQQVPERIQRYLDGMEHRRGRVRDEEEDGSWRTEILTRVQDGDLSVDEALVLLGYEVAEDEDDRQREGDDA